MRVRTVLAALATAPLAFASTSAGAADGGYPSSTDLNGSEEAPVEGDPNATGSADLRLNQGQGRVCFDLAWSEIDGTVTAAHIHEAPAGEPGDVVVPLFSGSFEGDDSASDCVEAEPDLVKAIRKDPTAYYVNVHSTAYPAGAIRGQLGD